MIESNRAEERDMRSWKVRKMEKTKSEKKFRWDRKSKRECLATT